MRDVDPEAVREQDQLIQGLLALVIGALLGMQNGLVAAAAAADTATA